MSDIFDHELDAWESLENECLGGLTNSNSDYAYDPLYYHIRYEFIRVNAETLKAIQFEFLDGGVQWVPKSLCKSLRRDLGTVYIWRGFEVEELDED